MNPTPRYTSLSQVQADLKAGKITCKQLVEYYLERIEDTKHLNAYVEVYASECLAKAEKIDKKIKSASEQLGRLAGMVLSHKDVICYEGHQVTGASKILEGFTSLFSATALERVLAEDALIIGRTNCDQFAMGSTNENSVYGSVKNAADESRVPGGSSGGSAVSVQADTCLAALGTDTGGSVRQPAALCGVVGMKPTYGRISRYGLLAYGSSFDQLGIISHSVEDASILLEIMAGPDDFDSTASHHPIEQYLPKGVKKEKQRIAYFDTALFHESIDGDVKEKSLALIEDLKAAGHEVEAVDFEYLDFIIPAYYVLTTAEASSNLARYDGIRYGHRSEEVNSLMETYKKSRTEGFSEEVKRRIMLGTFVLSSGYYDAYYTKAQKVRRLIRQRTEEIFQSYDFILMPVSPTPAWKIGDKSDDPVAMYLADIYTVQANMAGIPAIALPIGLSKENLPIGIQFMANKWEEAKLFSFAQNVTELIDNKL